jgi:hypothetical protein
MIFVRSEFFRYTLLFTLEVLFNTIIPMSAQPLTQLKHPGLKRSLLYLSFCGCLSLTACGSSEESYEQEYVTEEIVQYHRGLITELQEVEEGRFTIIDEHLADNPEESFVVAHNLDGSTDTLSLEHVKLIDTVYQSDTTSRAGSMNRTLRSGLFGYMLGRSLGSPTSASAYANPGVHNRVAQTTGNAFTSSTTRTTRTVPVSGRSGFGGGTSTRSYGG